MSILLFTASVILLFFMYSAWLAINPVAVLKAAGVVSAIPVFLMAFTIEFLLTLPFWAFVKFLSTLQEGGVL